MYDFFSKKKNTNLLLFSFWNWERWRNDLSFFFVSIYALFCTVCTIFRLKMFFSSVPLFVRSNFIVHSILILSNISFLCFCGCRIICSAKQTVSTNYWFKIFSKMFFVEIMKRTPDYRLDKIPLTLTQFTYKSR